MKRKHYIFIVIAVLLIATGYNYFRDRHTQADVIQKVFGGQERYGIFVASQQVTAQRMHWRKQDERFGMTNYNYEVPILITPAQIQNIQMLFTKPSSYE